MSEDQFVDADKMIEQPEPAQDKSGQCQCKCYKPKKGGCSYSCKKCTPEFGTLCVNNQEHLMRLVNEVCEPVKPHSAKASRGEQEHRHQYYDGANYYEKCIICGEPLPIQPSAQGKQSEEELAKRFEEFHAQEESSDMSCMLDDNQILRFIVKELSLSRQKERERIAKECPNKQCGFCNSGQPVLC